ncbi:uncharacterized protein METZ01_LOCUS425682 [marine metagenome]|uniref:Uncharacterized protein n=1 Tax=marine metagenome TaxID=408172 RepID=A0A382XRB4_9ZZZZ
MKIDLMTESKSTLICRKKSRLVVPRPVYPIQAIMRVKSFSILLK